MDEKIVQSLLLENKSNLHVTGVETVDNFNDETVILITNMGKLTIKDNYFSFRFEGCWCW